MKKRKKYNNICLKHREVSNRRKTLIRHFQLSQVLVLGQGLLKSICLEPLEVGDTIAVVGFVLLWTMKQEWVILQVQTSVKQAQLWDHGLIHLTTHLLFPIKIVAPNLMTLLNPPINITIRIEATYPISHQHLCTQLSLNSSKQTLLPLNTILPTQESMAAQSETEKNSLRLIELIVLPPLNPRKYLNVLTVRIRWVGNNQQLILPKLDEGISLILTQILYQMDQALELLNHDRSKRKFKNANQWQSSPNRSLKMVDMKICWAMIVIKGHLPWRSRILCHEPTVETDSAQTINASRILHKT